MKSPSLATLALGLVVSLARANPIAQQDMLVEECEDVPLDAQAAIAEPMNEMRFFPEMIEDQVFEEEEDCEEVEEPMEIPEDLHYGAASMAGQNEIAYIDNDECEEEEMEESNDYAFGYQEEDSSMFGFEGEAVVNDIVDVECEGDEAAEDIRGDYETAEDLGILENAAFASVDVDVVKMLDGQTGAENIEECEEEQFDEQEYDM